MSWKDDPTLFKTQYRKPLQGNQWADSLDREFVAENVSEAMLRSGEMQTCAMMAMATEIRTSSMLALALCSPKGMSILFEAAQRMDYDPEALGLVAQVKGEDATPEQGYRRGLAEGIEKAAQFMDEAELDSFARAIRRLKESS